MSLIIGLVGEKGSGKGTFAECIEECALPKTAVRVGSSQILGSTLALWDIPKNRANLQDLAIIMDTHFGKGTLTHAVEVRLRETPADIVIYDGIRWQSDVDMVRTFPNNLLVYITAPSDTRYARTKERKEKLGEATATFEQFMKEEEKETETMIPLLGASADISLINNGSIESYRNEIKKIFTEKIASLL